MDIKEASSCLFEFNTLEKLIKLIDRNIFYLENNTIYKFKVSDIKLSKTDNSNIMIILVCSPVSYLYYPLYHDEIELNLDDLHSKWFYDDKSCRDFKIKAAKNKQLSLW